MPPSHPSAELALVTGASSGIGRALALEFLSHGHDLVIAAEDEGIHTTAQDLQEQYVDRSVVAVRVDLSTAAGVEELHAAVTADGRVLTAAALNAGVVVGGKFVETDLADHLRLIDLNVRSTVHLAGLLAPEMVRRGGGRLLLTASIVAAMPGPNQSTYNASKAFVHSFAEGLRHELRPTGVTVTSLMPGPTDTAIFEKAGLGNSWVARGPKDDPGDVAAAAYAALMAGRDHVITGSLMNDLATLAGRVLPDRLTTAVQSVMTNPRDEKGTR